MGCCNDDGCSFQTDCVEGGTASDTKTLAWSVSTHSNPEGTDHLE